MTEVRPLSKSQILQLLPRAPQRWLPTAAGVYALGWVKCRAQISLLVIFFVYVMCMCVYVTNTKLYSKCYSILQEM